MKLFPDNETKKRFMRIWLPYILGFAWVPIIWILFIAVLGPLLFVLTGSWILVQGLILFLAIYVVYLLLRIFRRFNLRFYGEKSD
jgi:membrane protein YdbS with pleckstrin-like domain